MRSMSQTIITILRDEITDYRRNNRLSRETVAAAIVDAHEHMGADVVTGIRFEPKTVDTFERTKVNADRIFRWLDDVTKDGVLLPANFVTSVLAGLPDEVRRRILDRILLPLGFAARAIGGATPRAPISPAEVADLVREQGEASAAFTGLLDGYDRPELLNTRRQMAEAVEVAQRALARIDAKIAEGQEA